MSNAVRHEMPTGDAIWFYPEGHHYCEREPDEHKSGKCYNACPSRVPGGSTIAKNDGDTSVDNLMDWAVRLDRKGISREVTGGAAQLDWLMDPETIKARLESNGHDWRAIREEAADRGTLSHQVLEDLANGREPVTQSGYDEGVVSWWGLRNPKPLLVEAVVYSPHHRFAGTLDLLAAHGDGTISLFDLKTSSFLANAYAVQLNLYRIALIEAEHPVPDRLAIVQVTDEGRWKEVAVPVNPQWALSALHSYKTGRELGAAMRKAKKEALVP